MAMKKFLIIRFSSIGDIVLTTPVIRCVKQQVRGAVVHYLTKKQFEPVLSANPYVDKIWLYDHDFNVLIPQLKAEGYDFILDLHKNYRSSFVCQHFSKKGYSFPKLNFSKWMAVHLKLNYLPDIHIVDRYLMAAEKMNVRNDGKGLDYYIPAEDEVSLTVLPEKHRSGYIAIVIGAKHNTKIFPAEKVAEICNGLLLPVVLLGGNEDRQRGGDITRLAGELVFNACGLFNLNQSASLVKQARAVLTNDTGLMHIAAAFNKPVVSVWGNTIPAFGMYPYLPKENPAPSMIAEVQNLRCRPCSKIGYDKCPKKHFRCMNEIDCGEIVKFLRDER